MSLQQFESIAAEPSVPSHVPHHLVCQFDIYGLAVGDDPQAELAKLLDGPPVFYMPRSIRNPQGFGSWVFTRADHIRAILQDTVHFSSQGIAGFARMTGDSEPWLAYPVEADPPQHTQYRALLNPLFSPARVKVHEAAMRAHTVRLIEEFAPTGHCDMAMLARKLPAGIFSVLLGLSIDEMLAVVECVKQVLHSGYDAEKMRSGARGIMAIQDELIARRRAQPGDDLTSIALASTIEGRPLSDTEIRGMFFFFLFAGLDTIAAATGFLFRYLAEHAQVRAELIAEPDRIPDAIEDSLRRHGQITTNRFVKEDVELGGVRLQRGDNVLCPLALANLDPALATNPLNVDIHRSPNPHLAFGAGPHRCIGSNIARLQLRVTVEEWLRRIPDFRIPERSVVRGVNSEALVLATLPLAWDTAGPAS